jgi:hypothetical protein
MKSILLSKKIKEPDENTRESLLNNRLREKRTNKKLDKILLLIAITVVAFVLYGFIPGLSSYSVRFCIFILL